MTDGPFGETKELIAGFCLIQVKSKQEAIDWVKRVPNPGGEQFDIEIRPLFQADGFGPTLTPELRAEEERQPTGSPRRSARRTGDGGGLPR